MFYCLAEHGVWVGEKPLMALPPALGAEVLDLLAKNIPHRLHVQQEIKRLLSEILARTR